MYVRMFIDDHGEELQLCTVHFSSRPCMTEPITARCEVPYLLCNLFAFVKPIKPDKNCFSYIRICMKDISPLYTVYP